MAQVIDFTTGLRDRSFESIPQVHPPREYHMTVNGRLIQVRYVERFNFWAWSTYDCRWWDRQYLTGGQEFQSAAEAAQDALRRIVASKID